MFNPTEEFHQLNSYLQIYLNDIKRIDEHNRQLQQTIEHHRREYLQTFEEHFTRLPDDFRGESEVLTQAHRQRYEWKSRARRYLAEREELKKRIYFLIHTEKEEIKHRNLLERINSQSINDLRIIKDQFQHVYRYVQREKEIHQQLMDHLDQLRIQLEQISIERSKQEFYIQSLREEVKLIQTTKEFLHEEYQTLLSTQINPNEYFLSYFNQSIERIREDFTQLNQIQFKQMEDEYNRWINDGIHQSDEFTKLKNENEILSEKIFAMERDLLSIRHEQMEEFKDKEDQFQRHTIELQRLNEQLNSFVEYDRNLKFELTLYRGVLQSENRQNNFQKKLPVKE